MDEASERGAKLESESRPGVVLFGGAFNPPHLSHRRILAAALERLPVERAIVLPAGRHPHKTGSELAPDADRLRLCELAFGDLPGVEISDEDLRSDRVAYTVDTLQTIQQRLPGWRLFWLIGSDNLRSLDSWRDHHGLLQRATFVTWPRSGSPIDRAALSGLDLTSAEANELLEWSLEAESDDVSATEIRAELRAGRTPKELDPRVAHAIRSSGLYLS